MFISRVRVAVIVFDALVTQDEQTIFEQRILRVD